MRLFQKLWVNLSFSLIVKNTFTYSDLATCFRLSTLLGLIWTVLWNNSRDSWIFPSSRKRSAASKEKHIYRNAIQFICPQFSAIIIHKKDYTQVHGTVFKNTLSPATLKIKFLYSLLNLPCMYKAYSHIPCDSLSCSSIRL